MYELLLEKESAKNILPWVEPSANLSLSQNNQLATTLQCPGPIQGVHYTAGPLSQAIHYSNLDMAPNSGLAPMLQATPMASSSLVLMPSQSASMDDMMNKFKRELEQLFYEKYGIEPRNKVYQKP